jgi:predicted enzyme related to lactoylglutathione lyase
MDNESYICHIVIPSKNHQKSKDFYKKVFGWGVQKQSSTTSWDVLPPSRKGISAELNLEEEVVVPSIFVYNIEEKLRLIKQFGGKKLKDRTPIGAKAEYGYNTLFKDPHGNKMCLYSDK